MKAAILIYGMYREFNNVIKSWVNLDAFGYDCDYYFSTWNKSKQKYKNHDSYKEFDVTSEMITSYLPNCKYNILNQSEVFPNKLVNAVSMNYTGFHWKNLYKMVEESNTKYDIIFLVRSDSTLRMKSVKTIESTLDWVHNHTDELYSEQIVILKREFPSLSEKSYYYFQSSLYFIGSPNVVGKLIKNLPDMLDINLSFDPHNDFSNKLIELNLIPNASCPFEAGNFTRPIKIV